MRKIAIVAMLLIVYSHLYAQKGDKITISFDDVSIETALKKLDNLLTETDFSYNSKLPALKEKVTRSFHSMSLDSVLTDVFKGLPLTYKKVGSTIVIINKKKENVNGRQTVSGFVYDKTTGESLIGATISTADSRLGTVTNQYGFYSLTMDEEVTTIAVNYLGYKEEKILTTGKKRLDVKLSQDMNSLHEVVVQSDRASEEKQFAGVVSLTPKEVKQLPLFMGEPDILKAIQLQNGVKTVSDGASFYYVRGGNFDQNLVLMDEAPVYSPSHIMGLVSVINGDAIKNTNFYKGYFPAQYSGRLSSVLDIATKDGNNQSFQLAGGVSTIGARLVAEGPLVKDKVSYMISGRRSWIDKIMKGKNMASPAYYDVNAKLHCKLNANNKLYFSLYQGKDNFASDGTDYRSDWGNTLATVRWSHIFNEKLFVNTSVIYNHFRSFVSFSTTQNSWETEVSEIRLKHQLSYYLNDRNTITAGIKMGRHIFQPGRLKALDIDLGKKQLQSFDLYALHQWHISEPLTLNYGLNLNVTGALGKTELYTLDQNYNIVCTEKNKGGVYKTWFGVEPRVNLQYKFNDQHRLFAAYSRMQQFVQSPYPYQNDFDMLKMWIPVSNNVKPLKNDIFSAGYQYGSKYFSFSLEGYYKRIQNQLDFAPYPDVQSITYEQYLRRGKATSYGLEAGVGYKTNKVNLKIDYCYAKTRVKVPEINNGRAYDAKFDIPHQVNVIASYQFTKRWGISTYWKYSTGKPYTLPVGTQLLNGGRTIVPLYGNIHNARFKDYHRLDAMLTYRHKKIKDKWQGTVNVGVINAYGRTNPVSVSYNYEIMAFKPSTETFYKYLPMLSYNFKF
ncbi:TonB-dependent receptor domain-containing protein [Carboxylicivirga taeanensis]|uniref:TonB-dependent receptor domain-containing protein n=1 Tax=Carboxylicivirga taeanensis TaxID=1416875 RepID=UPI003F6DC6CB